MQKKKVYNCIYKLWIIKSLNQETNKLLEKKIQKKKLENFKFRKLIIIFFFCFILNYIFYYIIFLIYLLIIMDFFHYSN